MIRDAENTFSKDLDVSAYTATAAYSDVIYVGEGDAANQMYLYAAVTTALQDGTLTAVLQTSDTEAFTSATDLATYSISKTVGEKIKAKVPLGCKKYLRFKYTATLDASKSSLGAGKVTAFLAYDVNI